MNAVLTPEEKTKTTQVEMTIEEARNMKVLAWQKGISVQTVIQNDIVLFTAPIVFLALSGFLD